MTTPDTEDTDNHNAMIFSISEKLDANSRTRQPGDDITQLLEGFTQDELSLFTDVVLHENVP